jgi:sporulation protein YlmC with PRC-barrel domain
LKRTAFSGTAVAAQVQLLSFVRIIMQKALHAGLLAFGCWAFATSVAQAQPAVRVETPAAAGEARRATSIMGSTVTIRGGTSVGKVEDIVFNNDDYIEYLVVAEGGKNVLIPWQAAKYDIGKRAVTVDVAVDRYREIPTFARDRWPNVYDPEYQQKIYGYYGLRPGQERRIERRQNRP